MVHFRCTAHIVGGQGKGLHPQFEGVNTLLKLLRKLFKFSKNLRSEFYRRSGVSPAPFKYNTTLSQWNSHNKNLCFRYNDTRWRPWFNCLLHVHEYFNQISDFFESICGSDNDTLIDIKITLQVCEIMYISHTSQTVSPRTEAYQYRLNKYPLLGKFS